MLQTRVIDCDSPGLLEEELNKKLEMLQAHCNYKIKEIKYALLPETRYCESSYSAMIIFEE